MDPERRAQSERTFREHRIYDHPGGGRKGDSSAKRRVLGAVAKFSPGIPLEVYSTLGLKAHPVEAVYAINETFTTQYREARARTSDDNIARKHAFDAMARIVADGFQAAEQEGSPLFFEWAESTKCHEILIKAGALVNGSVLDLVCKVLAAMWIHIKPESTGSEETRFSEASKAIELAVVKACGNIKCTCPGGTRGKCSEGDATCEARRHAVLKCMDKNYSPTFLGCSALLNAVPAIAVRNHFVQTVVGGTTMATTSALASALLIVHRFRSSREMWNAWKRDKIKDTAVIKSVIVRDKKFRRSYVDNLKPMLENFHKLLVGGDAPEDLGADVDEAKVFEAAMAIAEADVAHKRVIAATRVQDGEDAAEAFDEGAVDDEDEDAGRGATGATTQDAKGRPLLRALEFFGDKAVGFHQRAQTRGELFQDRAKNARMCFGTVRNVHGRLDKNKIFCVLRAESHAKALETLDGIAAGDLDGPGGYENVDFDVLHDAMDYAHMLMMQHAASFPQTANARRREAQDMLNGVCTESGVNNANHTGVRIPGTGEANDGRDLQTPPLEKLIHDAFACEQSVVSSGINGAQKPLHAQTELPMYVAVRSDSKKNAIASKDLGVVQANCAFGAGVMGMGGLVMNLMTLQRVWATAREKIIQAARDAVLLNRASDAEVAAIEAVLPGRLSAMWDADRFGDAVNKVLREYLGFAMAYPVYARAVVKSKAPGGAVGDLAVHFRDGLERYAKVLAVLEREKKAAKKTKKGSSGAAMAEFVDIGKNGLKSLYMWSNFAVNQVRQTASSETYKHTNPSMWGHIAVSGNHAVAMNLESYSKFPAALRSSRSWGGEASPIPEAELKAMQLTHDVPCWCASFVYDRVGKGCTQCKDSRDVFNRFVRSRVHALPSMRVTGAHETFLALKSFIRHQYTPPPATNFGGHGDDTIAAIAGVTGHYFAALHGSLFGATAAPEIAAYKRAWPCRDRLSMPRARNLVRRIAGGELRPEPAAQAAGADGDGDDHGIGAGAGAGAGTSGPQIDHVRTLIQAQDLLCCAGFGTIVGDNIYELSSKLGVRAPPPEPKETPPPSAEPGAVCGAGCCGNRGASRSSGSDSDDTAQAVLLSEENNRLSREVEARDAEVETLNARVKTLVTQLAAVEARAGRSADAARVCAAGQRRGIEADRDLWMDATNALVEDARARGAPTGLDVDEIRICDGVTCKTSLQNRCEVCHWAFRSHSHEPREYERLAGPDAATPEAFKRVVEDEKAGFPKILIAGTKQDKNKLKPAKNLDFGPDHAKMFPNTVVRLRDAAGKDVRRECIGFARQLVEALAEKQGAGKGKIEIGADVVARLSAHKGIQRIAHRVVYSKGFEDAARAEARGGAAKRAREGDADEEEGGEEDRAVRAKQ